MTTTELTADTSARRSHYTAQRNEAPGGASRNEAFATQFRSSLQERDGKEFLVLEGTASVVEKWYSMWDMFGEYEEKVANGAFTKTLEANPDVNFLVNHKGLSMARTPAKTLELSVGMAGHLETRAWLNPQRQDVADLRHAIDDGAVDQMSFAFRITEFEWNDDYTQFVIKEVDLDRGDVSAVNYGANPFTSISARDAMQALDSLEGPALEAAHARIERRLAETRTAEPKPNESARLAALRETTSR
jgi:HK97 family phage prohead protease